MAHVSKKTSLAYYKPIAESEIPEGEFIYPLPRLSNGLHTLTFKVFDTLGNSSEVTIAFEVKENNETYTISLEEEPATVKSDNLVSRPKR